MSLISRDVRIQTMVFYSNIEFNYKNNFLGRTTFFYLLLSR